MSCQSTKRRRILKTWAADYGNEFVVLRMNDLFHWDRHPEKLKWKTNQETLRKKVSYHANIEHLLQRRRERKRNNGRNMTNGYISDLLRRRVSNALSGNTKAASTMELVGIASADHLRAWLQLHFKPGMSWQNYGAWEIDHIIPCASFDLSDPANQRKCFHYTNLQPLWAGENRSKGDRL